MNLLAHRLIVAQLLDRPGERRLGRADQPRSLARRRLRVLLLSTLTPMSWPEIAAEVGYGSHARAVAALADIEQAIAGDVLLREAVAALAEAVREIGRLHGLAAPDTKRIKRPQREDALRPGATVQAAGPEFHQSPAGVSPAAM